MGYVEMITNKENNPLIGDKKQESIGNINGVNYLDSIKSNLDSKKTTPEWEAQGYDSDKDKFMADYMKERGFSYDDYTEAKGQLQNIELKRAEEEDERSFFQKLYVEPMTDEDIRFEGNQIENFVKNEAEWIMKNVIGGVANIVTGLADIGTKAVGGTIDYSGELLTGNKSLEDIGDDLVSTYGSTKEVVGIMGKYYKDTYFTDLESFQKATMENPTAIIGDALTLISAGGYGVTKINKIQSALLKTQKGAYVDAMVNANGLQNKANVYRNVIEINKKILQKTKNIKSLEKGIAIANKYNPYIAGPKLAYNGIKVIGKPISAGIKGLIGEESLITSTLRLNMTDVQKIKKMLPNGESSYASRMIKKGIIKNSKVAGGREGILDNLVKFSRNAYDRIDDGLSTISNKYNISSADKALNKLVARAKGVVGLEDDLAFAYKMKDKLSNGGLNLSELQQIKRAIDKNLQLYTRAGNPSDVASKVGMQKVRADLRTFIADEASKYGVKNIVSLSDDVRISRGIGDALSKRIDGLSKNNLISITDYITAGGATAMAGDFGTTMLILSAKKIFETPQFKLALQKGLYQVPKQVLSKIKVGKVLSATESAIVDNVLTKYIKERGVAIKNDISSFIKRQQRKSINKKLSEQKTSAMIQAETKMKSLDFFKKQSTIVDDVLKDGGGTYLVGGKTKIGYGEPYVVVSMYPNRGSGAIPKAQFNQKVIGNFIEKNADVLMKDNHSLGLYVDNAGNIHIDVSVIAPKTKLKEAIDMGKKYDQISIWDNETFKEISTGGTGKNIIKVTDAQIQDDIDRMFGTTKNKLAGEELVAGGIGEAGGIVENFTDDLAVAGKVADDVGVVESVADDVGVASEGAMSSDKKTITQTKEDAGFGGKQNNVFETEGGVLKITENTANGNSIQELFVDESARRQGIATSLLKEAQGEYNYISAQVSNEASVSLHYQNGFRPFEKPSATLEESINMFKKSPESMNMFWERKPEIVPSGKPNRYLDADGKEVIVPKTSSKKFVDDDGKYIGTTKDVDDLYDYYKKTYNNGNNSIIIDSDNIKQLFTDYNPDTPELVHTASSKLASGFYRKALAENPSNRVILTAGGGGSGKSEGIVKGLLDSGEDVIIFDGTGKDYDKMVSNAKLAREAGKDVEIQAVYIPFFIAKEFNELRKRTVPLDILEATHKGMRETTLRILEEGEIPTTLISNLGTRIDGKAVFIEIENPLEFLKTKLELEYERPVNLIK